MAACTSLRIRAVLFDAVGTLVHLREPVGVTYARLAAAQGASIPASHLEEAFGRVLAAAPPNVHPGCTPETVEARERAWWRERVRETFRTAAPSVRLSDFELLFEALWHLYGRAAAWRLTEGVHEAFRALRQERALAVLSNFDHRLRSLLRELGLAAHLDAVVLPADAGAAKPDARIFQVALARLGLAADQAVHVGDHARRDLAASRAVGMHAIDVGELATLAELPARVATLEEAS